MSKKKSFDSQNSSDIDEDETDVKRKQSINREDSPQKSLPNYELILAISSTLKSILDQNKELDNYKEIIRAQSHTVFSANLIPNIPVKDYLLRIQTYANVEKSTLIISLIFIDRLCNKAKITLTYYNIHRILFSAILIGIKYNEDNFYDNKYYAKIAGVKLKELITLEYHFIKLLNCSLYVSKEEYDKYQGYLDNYNFDDN